ncbi:hypothetical protein [Dyadobacter sp. CY343]|uniref:hypothetical protein n=1 Tax=Dyadobacter sp. CY343 TaxID=2907299 RepID=UPI001F1EAFAA|nr:hypothetical protein [Dyadobacter sp. CY343]MCE7059727.1 hypothetical protein [Dyadobacter sp. CY343]
MLEPVERRQKKLTLCLNQKEYDRLLKRLGCSTCRNMGEFIRKLALATPVTYNQRNQSLDELLNELIRLRMQLIRIEQNVELSAQVFSSLNQNEDQSMWLLQYQADSQAMLSHIQVIKSYVTQAAQKWLPS